MSTQPAPLPIGICSMLVAVTTIAIVLRIVSRRLSGASLWWDDWLVIAAWPFSTAISISFIPATFHGFGSHGGDPSFFFHTLYFDEMCYQFGIALTKLSVLFFYRRIFAISPGFKTTLIVVGVFVLLWWLAGLLAAALQCIPAQGFWDKSVEAKCEYQFGFFIGQAVPNIALDFTLLLLPLPALLSLRIKRVQRMALVGVFVLGYLNPVVSILRIVSFVQLGPDTQFDANYALMVPALWSISEVAVAIVSCSIPGMAYLFRRLFKTGEASHNGSRAWYLKTHPPSQDMGGRSAVQAGSIRNIHSQSSRSDTNWLISTQDAMAPRGNESQYAHPLPDIHVKSEVNVEFDEYRTSNSTGSVLKDDTQFGDAMDRHMRRV